MFDAARMFGLPYAQPTSMPQFLEAYRQASRASHSSLIEVQTDRRQTRELYRLAERAVKEAST